MKTLLSALILLGLLLAGPATADSFRCNNQFVHLGDRKVTVLLRCGEPFFAEVISGDDQIVLEEWTYRPRGYKGFLRVLTFRGGRLVDIRTAEKVR